MTTRVISSVPTVKPRTYGGAGKGVKNETRTKLRNMVCCYDNIGMIAKVITAKCPNISAPYCKEEEAVRRI
jgi:hypothetical protein